MRKTLELLLPDYPLSPKERLRFNKLLFEEVAPKYDFITTVLSLGRDTAWKDRLIKQLPEIESPRCLDLACGTGDITRRLAVKYPRGSVVGLDLTEAMVELARSRNSYDNVTFTIKSICHTCFDDDSFDIVTGGYALRNAVDIKSALTEVRRVLKPGGTAAFLDFSKPANALLQKIEFAVLKTWGGFWGVVLHENAHVYGYIAESLRRFCDSQQLKQLLSRSGFVNIRSQKYYLGMAEAIACRKQSRLQ